MKRYFSITKSVLLAAVLTVFCSCKDTFDDHYSFHETESKYPVAKIAETLEGISGFDKFYEALRTTKMCDKKGVPQKQTFLDLLLEDQFITVFAPSDASINDWSLYTKRDKTDAENYEVAEKFLNNHIARFKHSVGSDTVKVTMLNGKNYIIRPADIAGQGYHGDDRNIRCSNGVLHCIDGKIDFLPSLYEYLTTAPEYKEKFGDWFKSFTIEELDPYESVAMGLNENGEIVYIDSVTYESNILMSRYGRILAEDSTYAIVMPSPALWDSVYNRISKSFVYAERNLNNDSLMQFYTRTTMMTDMFFSMNPYVQHFLPDSVLSTRYSAAENRREGLPYHIFGHPYAADGIFGSAIQTIKCSNGDIYVIDEWPFSDELTYLRPIKLEAEAISNLTDFTAKQYSVDIIGTDTLKTPAQVMRISQSGVKNWTAQIYLYDNLKGKYNVKAVLAPNTEDKMPNYLHPIVQYSLPAGGTVTLLDSSTTIQQEIIPGMFIEQKLPHYLINDLTKLDTMEIGVVEVPYCNYDMPQARLSLTLVSGVNERNSSRYSSEMWLDCIILEPVVE
jgi:uncharacterized surface protein with fasciclin (FAS1) repeats